MGAPIPKRVILTRSREDIQKDRVFFERNGFAVEELPLIEIEPIPFKPPEQKPDIVIFQSARAVKFFLKDHPIPKDARIVAVGEKTASAVKSFGYRVSLIPKENSAQGVLDCMPPSKGELVLVPRSEQGRVELIEGLRHKGYRVVPLNVYRTKNPLYKEERLISVLKEGGFIVFASPSAVRGLFANLQNHDILRKFNNLIVVAIGKTTKGELEKFGVVPSIIPTKPMMEAVAGKIHEFWQENCTY